MGVHRGVSAFSLHHFCECLSCKTTTRRKREAGEFSGFYLQAYFSWWIDHLLLPQIIRDQFPANLANQNCITFSSRGEKQEHKADFFRRTIFYMRRISIGAVFAPLWYYPITLWRCYEQVHRLKQLELLIHLKL